MPKSSERSLKFVHHELMNRLAVLSTYSHLLREEELDADVKEMVDEMIGSAKQANALCRELADNMDLDSIVGAGHEQRQLR